MLDPLAPPHLTFACELGRDELVALFSDGAVVKDLQVLGASVALMLSDFSEQRAAVVRTLNAAGIPVVAVPLVAAGDGYYFTADNPSVATARYEEWKAWTSSEGLVWCGLGLDIEPDVRLYQQIADHPWRVLPVLLRGLRDRDRPRRASFAYSALVERIRSDGWTVESYQLPPMADERRVGSTLLQRALGLVDVRTDREVWMLYSSFFGALGAGLIWSYGPEAPAIAVGSTGGAPDIPGSPHVPTLNWDELARDLSLARHWSDTILIHSLEGCVEQGFLPELKSFTWTQANPPSTARLANWLRVALRAILWSSKHSRALGVVAITTWLVQRGRTHGTGVNEQRLASSA
ncbi:MAG: hypothetical protein ABI345_13375 [Jatrophihabitans sp.]